MKCLIGWHKNHGWMFKIALKELLFTRSFPTIFTPLREKLLDTSQARTLSWFDGGLLGYSTSSENVLGPCNYAFEDRIEISWSWAEKLWHQTENIILHQGKFVLIDLVWEANRFEDTPVCTLDARVDAVDFMLDIYCIVVTLMRFCLSIFDIGVRRINHSLQAIVDQKEWEP